jgi:hypothetical protein
MLSIMRELFTFILDAASALRTELHAVLSIPLMDAARHDESEGAVSDSVRFGVDRGSSGKSLKCVEDHPGYLTTNGLGSLEIGATFDD